MITGPSASGGLSAALNIAASGLDAAATQVDVAASNIANLNTPGYQPQRADLVTLSGGGVGVAGISSGTNGGANTSADGGSNVDLANEMMQLTRAKLLYSANAVVLRAANQMLGTLLDVVNKPNDDTTG